MKASELVLETQSSLLLKGHIESYPKTIDNNGCWIPKHVQNTDGYVRITIDYTRYVLNRLVLSVYHNIDYFNNSILTRHKCNNPPCFNPEHVIPGSHSDNMMDSVAVKTHIHARKDVCPKCGGPYTVNRNGNGKQVWVRRCNKCKQTKRKEARKVKNESL